MSVGSVRGVHRVPDVTAGIRLQAVQGADGLHDPQLRHLPRPLRQLLPQVLLREQGLRPPEDQVILTPTRV